MRELEHWPAIVTLARIATTQFDRMTDDKLERRANMARALGHSDRESVAMEFSCIRSATNIQGHVSICPEEVRSLQPD